MKEETMSHRVKALVLAAALVLAVSAPALAAPPNNHVNYNVDVEGGFQLWSIHTGSYLGVDLSAHGNDPDGWPTTLEFHLGIHGDGYDCDYDDPAIGYVDNGDTLTISVVGGPSGPATSSCGEVYDFTIVVDYDASTYREHTNSTGEQRKNNGLRDNSADVTVFVHSDPGDNVILDESASNVVLWQALKEQIHSKGTPGNPH
jgi:hypothetical protein